MKNFLLLDEITFCMKLITIQVFLFATFTFVSLAKSADAQGVLDKKISLNAHNEEVKTIISEINRKTEVEFIFSSTSIETDRKVSIKAVDKKIKDILDELFGSNNVAYKVLNNQVLLYKTTNLMDGSSSDADLKQKANPITGTITNVQNGEPLAGASITIKGQKTGASSDADGKFVIDAKPGDVLIISLLGYTTQEITVGAASSYAIKLITNFSSVDVISVIGSRGRPRTDVERPVPVDVFSAEDIQKTGQTELGQMIHYSAPSFNSTKYGISNVTSYVDPATLRGLGPDQTLVLINGKRRHQSAALNVNNVVGRGTVGTDLNVIPSAAIERVEILRDGAAAQYGSDAIAGIVNLQLRRNNSGGQYSAHYGLTKEGDGKTYEQSVNFGLPLGKNGGFFNTTLQMHHNDPTDRSEPYTGTVYSSDATVEAEMIEARNFDRQIEGTKYGIAKNTNGIAFYNAEIPLKNDWAIYSFGGYSYKDITAYGFFRPPSNTKRRVLEIYPNGYSPVFPATLQDISNAVGVKRTLLDGWNMDFSNTFGRNHIALYSNNTVNPSYGQASPTEFFGGNLIFSQNSTNVDFYKALKVGNLKSFDLSFGAEGRLEHYKINQGDDASWMVGPLTGTDVGASGREGFSANNAVSRNRSNIGVYGDLETDINHALLLGAALRFENYSDFGSNLSGKLSARYKIGEYFSLRGSINKGFRAPSMHQLYYSSDADAQWLTIDGVFDSYPVGHLRNDNPYVKAAGVDQLKPETSMDYNLGATLNFKNKFVLTVDAYQIDIKDKIVISSQLNAASPELSPIFSGSGYALVQFFSNAIDTRTKGLDIVSTFNQNLGLESDLSISAALMFNETKVRGDIRTPSELTSVGSNLIDRSMIGLIEVAQPKSKVILSANYSYKMIEAMIRGTYFGEVSVWQNDAAANQDQTFGAKILTDVSLTWNITKRISWTLGANNVGNVYPDRIAFPSLTGSGQTPYTRFTNQFGFMGAYYYTAVRVGF